MTAQEKHSFATAVRLGLASADDIEDWIQAWHDRPDDGRSCELHEFLGLTFAQYGRWVAHSTEIESILREVNGATGTDDIVDGPFRISFDITGNKQERDFINATLSGAAHGQAISIAIIPPDGLDTSDRKALATMLRKSFHHLTQMGWDIEVQVGPDQSPESAEHNDASIAAHLDAFLEARG